MTPCRFLIRILSAVPFLAAGSLFALPKPAPLFSDHMVLQQGCPLPIWGSALPGETVTATIDGHSAEGRADAKGVWRLMLPSLKASAKPAELVLRGTADPGAAVVLPDVLVGEVWLCSGQSNMEFPLRKATGGEDDALASAGLPIRQFRVPETMADAPAGTMPGAWATCTPSHAREFTAVGFYFAREVHAKLGVPIGLIDTAVGGTVISAWMSEPTLRSDPAFGKVIERRDQAIADWPAASAAYRKALAQWQDAAAARAAGKEVAGRRPRPPMGPGNHNMPWTLWNGMIHPLIPCGIRGVLWYQAEQNWNRPDEYAPLFKALITQWRGDWGRDRLPFYFVQLPNFGGSGRLWPWLREAQEQALELPATGMAVTIDVGESRNQHPHDKRDVGHRLALMALADVYHQPEPDDGRSPSMLDVKPVTDSAGPGALRVRFRHATGLTTADGVPPEGFEIAGEDRRFVRAEARIDPTTMPPSVIVRAPGVASPAALRYAWADSPLVNLRNAAGLPVAPFRTDGWPQDRHNPSPIKVSEK